MNKQILILVVFILGVMSQNDEQTIIGVYTQKYIYEDIKNTNILATLTYINPSYSHFIHMAGAKVVPIYSYMSQQQIKKTLDKINGVLFPGGEEDFNINSTWIKNAQYIINYAQRQNNQGRVFPILGICQGLQLLLYLKSDRKENFLQQIKNQEGVFNTLNFVNHDYYLLNGVAQNTLKLLSQSNTENQNGIAYFFHHFGLLNESFQNDQKLTSYWNLFSTTTKDDQIFVSYLQAKNYPFYMVMFHPQKMFFKQKQTNQFYRARIDFTSTISFNFVMKARESPHCYPQEQLKNDVIQNFPLASSKRFTETKVYIFQQSSLILPQQEPNLNSNLSYILMLFLIGCGVYMGYRYYEQRKLRTAQQNNQNNHISINDSFH